MENQDNTTVKTIYINKPGVEGENALERTEIVPGVTPRHIIEQLGLPPGSWRVKKADEINFLGHDENIWGQLKDGDHLKIQTDSPVAVG
jgi:hypothetical protein